MSITPTQDVPAIGEDNQGKVTMAESRIRNGWHAHAIFRKLEWDDTNAEQARANIDYQIDGGPPYDPQVMRDANRGDEANVNFREARAEDDLAQTPFIEMTTVTPTLWNIRTNHGNNETDKAEWTRIISEEFTKTVRTWGEDFDYFRLRLAQQFTRHGAGFAYFEDELNWQWRADGLSPFKLPRKTESRASAIQYCICKREMGIDELYAFIRDEKFAEEQGRWNIEAVKRALVYASSTSGATWTNYSWEQFQKEVKENDIEFSTRSETVRIFHLWCREFNGTVSHYIGLQDGVAMEQGENFIQDTKGAREGAEKNMVGNGFLYAHRCRFPSFESAIIPFFYAIGTHATIHTIRGQGEMNFAPISLSNRITCKMADLATVSSMLLLGVDTANEAQNIAFVQRGAFMVYSRENGAKAEPTAMPDVTSRLNPLLDRMSSLRRQVSPSNSQPDKMGKSKQPKNKYEIQSEQNKTGSLNSAMLTQWFGPWGRLGREMYRRMMNPKLSDEDPGGREAFDFRAACMSRGVPLEAMQYAKVTVDAVRTIGNGSPEQRQYASEQILEMSEKFDEHGKWQATIDAVSSIPGVNFSAALDYVGPEKPRQPIDKQVANVENALFVLGQKQPVESEENHWVHCLTHSELVKQTLDAFNNGEMEGAKLVPILSAALDNMLAHSKFLSDDQSKQKESAWVRKFVQNANGTLEQQENKLIAEQQRQAEAQQQSQGQPPAGGGGDGQPDQASQMEMHAKGAEEARKQDKHQMEMSLKQQGYQMRQQRFTQELISQDQDARQKRSIADLEAAHAIAVKNATLASGGV